MMVCMGMAAVPHIIVNVGTMKQWAIMTVMKTKDSVWLAVIMDIVKILMCVRLIQLAVQQHLLQCLLLLPPHLLLLGVQHIHQLTVLNSVSYQTMVCMRMAAVRDIGVNVGTMKHLTIMTVVKTKDSVWMVVIMEIVKI